MNYRKFIELILVTFVCCQNITYAGGKSDRLKPQWVTHTLPEPQSNSYIFVRSHGEGSSLAGAKQMAFVSMSQKLEIERGLTVNTSVQSRERLYQSQKSSGNEYEQEIILDVTEDGHKLKIVCREIDEYWTENSGRYNIDVLYTVTNKNSFGGSYDDEIKVTAKYGAETGCLSIIPSVGQFYKGSIVKGSLILAGEVAAAGGIILCEDTRASYIKKMQEQPKHAADYNSLADSWETGRNVCIGAAAAIYVYNLIDAFVSPGAKRVVVTNKGVSLSAMPYRNSKSSGISLTFNF